MDERAAGSNRRRRDDAGQAMGLVLISIALVASIAVAMMSIAGRMVDRSSAQMAADAAALAGVEGGRSAAAAMAQLNSATLVSFERRAGDGGFVVTVTVAVGDERAVARASSTP